MLFYYSKASPWCWEIIKGRKGSDGDGDRDKGEDDESASNISDRASAAIIAAFMSRCFLDPPSPPSVPSIPESGPEFDTVSDTDIDPDNIGISISGIPMISGIISGLFTVATV